MSTEDLPASPVPAETAGVIARPPLIYAGALLAGWGLDQAVPAPVTAVAGVSWVADRLGPALILVSLGIAGWCIALFVRAGTNVPTSRPTLAIVTTGPYRLSRNPIYVALTGLSLGIALTLDSLWCVAVLAPVLAVMHWGVVLREERYLEARFGETYLAFKHRTRRWI